MVQSLDAWLLELSLANNHGHIDNKLRAKTVNGHGRSRSGIGGWAPTKIETRKV